MLSISSMWGTNSRQHTQQHVNTNDENDEEEDNKSSITALSSNSISNILVKTQQTSTAVSEWWEQTKLKLNPEVWLDPQLQVYLQQIQTVKLELHEQRYGPHRSSVRQQQRHTVRSIHQQKAFLVRKLARQLADCTAHHRKTGTAGERDVYETEILAIVHEEGLTALELKDLIDVKGPDDIDKLLDSTNFDYSYCESSHDEEKEQEKEDTEDKTVEGNTSVSSHGNGGVGRVSTLHENEFGDDDDDKNNDNENENSNRDGSDKIIDTKKKKRATKNATAAAVISIDHSTLVPLEVKVLRAQHTEWMAEHQMDCVRTFQQQEMERMYDIRTEQQLERETLRSTNHLQCKIEALRTTNDAWQAAYHQHVENQETLIAYLRDHVSPEHRDPSLPSPPPSPISEKDLDETKDDIVEAEKEDTIESLPYATDRSSRLSSRQQQQQLQRPKRGGARNIWAQLFASETNNNSNSNGNNKENGGENTSTAEDVDEDHDKTTNTNENGIPTSVDASTKSPAVDRDDTDNDSLSVTSSISHTLISPLTADTTRRKFRLSFGSTSVTTPTTPSKKMSSGGLMAKFGGFGALPLTTNASTDDDDDDDVNGNDNTINININTNTVDADDEVDGESQSDTSMDLIRTTKPSDSLDHSLLPDSLNERRVKRAAARKVASSTRKVSTAKRSSNSRKARTKESQTDVLELVRERTKPADTHHDTNESPSAARRKNAVVRDPNTDRLSKSSDHSLQER